MDFPPVELITDIGSLGVVAIAYGVLDLRSRRLHYSSGGHTPFVVQKGVDQLQLADADGMAIGWMDDIDFEEVMIDLEVGDRVYLYSDGVPEAMSGQLEQFGDDRMLQVVRESRTVPLAESVGALQQSVLKWCGRNGPLDDVSILGLEITDGS